MWIEAVEELIGRPMRAKQMEVLDQILQRNHVFAALPTNYGKSLCFGAFPTAFKQLHPGEDTTVLVISPLNALSASHEKSWQELGVKSVVLTPSTNMDTMKAVEDGEFDLLIASPEIIQREDVWLMVKSLRERIHLLVLDEVHCLTNWGKSFRPEYLRAVQLRAVLPRAVVLALTATATQELINEVSELLGLDDKMSVVSLSPDRPEIFLKVLNVGANMDDSLAWYAELLLQKQDEAPRAIIYAKTIDIVSAVYVYFTDYLGDAAAEDGALDDVDKRYVEMFHGSTDSESQQRIVDNFRKPDSLLRCVVASIAFGLGIDIPNVRYVLHWGASKTAIAYWQEVGRCSRDGNPGEAIMYVYPWGKAHSDECMHTIIESSSDVNVCIREKVLMYMEVSVQEPMEKRIKCCFNCSMRARRTISPTVTSSLPPTSSSA